MNNAILIVKYALVALVVAMLLAFAAFSQVSFHDALQGVVAIVGALVVSLGLKGAGESIGAGVAVGTDPIVVTKALVKKEDPL